MQLWAPGTHQNIGSATCTHKGLGAPQCRHTKLAFTYSPISGQPHPPTSKLTHPGDARRGVDLRRLRWRRRRVIGPSMAGTRLACQGERQGHRKAVRVRLESPQARRGGSTGMCVVRQACACA